MREAVSRFLRARGFEVQLADTVRGALDRLRQTHFAALLCDVRMPGSSGMQLLPEARRLDRDLAIVMLTGVNDAATAAEALAQGAADYLLKPIELDELHEALDRALTRRRTQIEAREREQAGRESTVARVAELERTRVASDSAAVTVLGSMVTLMEAKDPFRAGHSQRVAELAAALAEALALDADAVANVHLAGRVHDIGNVAISETVLRHPGPLSDAERDVVRQHVRIGVQLLSPLAQFRPVLTFVRDHHEHWDGRGYPAALRDTSISIGGRILAVADAFVAVTAGRPYAPVRPAADALAHLATLTNSQFDPAVVRALGEVVQTRSG